MYCHGLIRLAHENKHNLDSVEKLCQSAIKQKVPYAYPYLYLGSVYYVRSFLFKKRLFSNNAQDYLNKSIALFQQAQCYSHDLYSVGQGCASVFLPSVIPTIPKSAWNNEIIFDDCNIYDKADTTILFFACDGLYFQEYAFLLVASLARFKESLTYHAHIINPSINSADVILKIRQHFPWIQFNVSIEFCQLKHQKAYYASARFLQSERLLNLYQRPLLIVDVDSILEKPMEVISNFAQHHDIGLIIRDEHFLFPWTEIPALAVYLNNTQKTKEFLQLLTNALLSQLLTEEDKSIWYIDQNALFAVYRYMREQLSVCNLIHLQRPSKLFNAPVRLSGGKRTFTETKLIEYGFDPKEILSKL
jgi:hypothetical protein